MAKKSSPFAKIFTLALVSRIVFGGNLIKFRSIGD